MNNLHSRPITIRVTRNAYRGAGGAVVHGVEVDKDTLTKVNKFQHLIISVEGSDQDVVISEIKKGMLVDVTPKTKLKGRTEKGFERILITTTNIEILRPESKLIVDLIGGSSRFKGIGPVKAKKLWGHFGGALFELLDSGDVKTLCQILTEEAAKNAINAWQTYILLDEVRFCNMTLHLPVSMSLRVVSFYRNETIAKLNENPYRLLAFGLPFMQCDGIASDLGFFPDSAIRLTAAVEASLYKILDKGSTAVLQNELAEPLTKLLGSKSVSDDDLEELVSQALSEAFSADNYVVLAEKVYQSNGAFMMECFVAQRLFELIKKPMQLKTSPSKMDEIIDRYEQEKGFELTSLQKQAVTQATLHHFFIINGGAGVGKTTVLDAMYRVFQSIHIKPIQIALAGKAAKRMTEATGYESYTIARFLRSFDFKKHKGADLVVVIDESSMVDLPSMYRLLKFIPDGTRILMLGDTGQLPPVDFGLVLHELIEIDLVPKITLTKVKRQGKDSNIPAASVKIRQGEIPDFKNDDVRFIAANSIGIIKKKVADLYSESPDSTQVICPTNRMADAINELCASFNTKPRLKVFVDDYDRYQETQFRLSDKVMCCKNLYDMDIMNGSVGEVAAVYQQQRVIKDETNEDELVSYGQILWDDGVTREVTVGVIDALKLAYAMTIHKSQGSQFERVIIPIDGGNHTSVTMYYTAITRSEKEVIFVGNEKLLRAALLRNSANERMVNLGAKLSHCFAIENAH
jgi:exodeoxyribonuclease V alpha subunit